MVCKMSKIVENWCETRVEGIMILYKIKPCQKIAEFFNVAMLFQS